MQVFIAGATGVLGRRLVARCADRDHDVVGLTRDDRGDAIVREAGGEPRRGDVLEPETLPEAARGSDVIVHAATKIPTSSNPSADAWALNDRVRREGTENLVEVAGDLGADRFVQQSVVWIARQPNGEPFDETAEPHPDRSTRSALDAERTVESTGEDRGFDSVLLRGGYFYAADASHTQLFGERLLDRNLPIIGRGLFGRTDATLSFLHVDDAASAFAHAIDGTATGLYHVVDDEPVTYARFLEEFADSLDAPSPRRVPAWLARFFVGRGIINLLTRPMPTSNDQFEKAFDWSPQYPTYREGLDQVVEQWRETGVIRASNDGYEWGGA